MKTVYFVRHAESQANASLFYQQTGSTKLTKRGGEQAKEVARFLKKLPIKGIVSSTFDRARATAEAIQAETKLTVDYSELFIERRRPSIQIRLRKIHPYWLWTQLKLWLFSHRSTYRHSDEETPEELLKRAHKALQYITQKPEEVLVVVTHGRFVRALYAVMTLGEGITGRLYLRATRGLHIRNTAIMVATYENEVWEVKAWNADAHSL